MTDYIILEHQKKDQLADEVTIASIFARYFEKYGSQLKSADNVQLALRYWLEFHEEATLAEAGDLAQQEAFRNWLQQEKKLSLSTVRKVVTIGKSAFNWSHKRGEIERVPYFELVKPPTPEPKGRHLEVSEIARLLSNSEQHHIKMFILLLIGTAARPRAVLDLTFDQVDFRRNIIDLNPVTRTQVKNKRRPVVKLPDALRSIIQAEAKSSKCQHVVSYNGMPVNSIRTSWRKLRDKAELDAKVLPYSIRRTMARFLRMEGVSAWQVAEQLGHSGHATGMHITELYTSHSPDFLQEAVAAIDVLFGLIACELRVSTLDEIFSLEK